MKDSFTNSVSRSLRYATVMHKSQWDDGCSSLHASSPSPVRNFLKCLRRTGYANSQSSQAMTPQKFLKPLQGLPRTPGCCLSPVLYIPSKISGSWHASRGFCRRCFSRWLCPTLSQHAPSHTHTHIYIILYRYHIIYLFLYLLCTHVFTL